MPAFLHDFPLLIGTTLLLLDLLLSPSRRNNATGASPRESWRSCCSAGC